MTDIAEVKQRLDIIGVASQYVALQKAGRNFKGLCPFHIEKTPSFFIFPERQSWHCFGCGAGGDVFSLMMKKEGLDFGEALRLLAGRVGVTLAREKGHAAESKQRLYDINEAAAQFYHQALVSSPEGKGALSYVEGRGINRGNITAFLLGFSPPDPKALPNHLQGQGYSEGDLAQAGLALEGRDRFRGRLMFPIRDRQGRAIGFSSRALDQAQPKYLNSPQTPAFDKGGTLYGLDRALPAIRSLGEAVVVEGYFDVIAAHQAGYSNVVASMGTSITPRQVALLKGSARSLVLALDADAAGDKAVLRGIQVARQALERSQLPVPDFLGASARLQAEVKVAILPQGQDPDEVIARSPQGWEALISGATHLMDYIFQATLSQLDLSRAQERSRAARQLLPFIAEVEDPVERELYLTKLAQALGVSEKALAQVAVSLRPSPVPGQPSPPPTSPPLGERMEEYCLYLLFHYGPLDQGVDLELFQGTENRELLARWLQRGWEGLRSGLDPALEEHLQAVLELEERALPPALPGAARFRQGLAQTMPLSLGEARRALAQCLRRLRERRLRQLAQATPTLEEAQRLGVAQELRELFRNRTY